VILTSCKRSWSVVRCQCSVTQCCFIELMHSRFYARISYSNSVLLSVMSRYRSKPKWDRDFWFSPYDSFRVSCIMWQNFMPLGKGGPHERAGERRAPPLKGVILPLLALLTWKWLQIGTDTGELCSNSLYN